MNCPSCGGENADGALSCGLCSLVLEPGRAQPPRAAFKRLPPKRPLLPGEPAALEGESLDALLRLAFRRGEQGDFASCESLMGRLYLELEPEDAAEMTRALGRAWLGVAKLPAGRKEAAASLLEKTVAHLRRHDLEDALAASLLLLSYAQEETAEAARFSLALLGIKGARAARSAAELEALPAPEPPVAEPRTLDSVEAWQALFELAQHNALARHLTEASRLMTRLASELPVADLQAMIALVVEAWLKTEGFEPEKRALARALALEAAAAAGKKDLAAAHRCLARLVGLITKGDIGPGFKMTLLAMGLRGAAGKAAPGGGETGS